MSTRLKPYPSYKDSGVEWLGRIPAHWEVARVAEHCHLINGFPFDSDRFNHNHGIPLVRIRDIDSQETEVFYDGPMVEDASIRNGDILVGMDGDFNVATWRGASALLNQRVCCLRSRQTLEQRFLRHLLAAPLEVINDLTYSTTVKHLSSPDVRRIRFGLPPRPEQQSIASFLDRETGKIDALVAKKERLVELLQEKRTALISHAVTQGLNPNVPKKDSGIPWLGRIPEHWGVRRLAVIASKITNGFVGPTRDILVDQGIRYLQSLHIKDGQIRFETPYFVRPNWSREHAKSVLAEGDVLVVQTGDLGQCATVTKEFNGANCHALIIVRLRYGVGSGDFLSAFLRSHYGRASLRCCETGATLPHLECGKVREIAIALPPSDEQAAIMNHVHRETAKLDALMAKVRTAIERFQEYRTALISAAVTGQIDVRSCR